jgi:hypothetical protein
MAEQKESGKERQRCDRQESEQRAAEARVKVADKLSTSHIADCSLVFGQGFAVLWPDDGRV